MIRQAYFPTDDRPWLVLRHANEKHHDGDNRQHNHNPGHDNTYLDSAWHLCLQGCKLRTIEGNFIA
jgi:hypothetical protein